MWLVFNLARATTASSEFWRSALKFKPLRRGYCKVAGATSPLHVRHDERADRAVVTAAAEAHMAMVILTRLDLLMLEQVACWDVEPAGYCLHQLIAGDGEAIHIAAAD